MKGFRQDRQGNGGEAKEGRRGRESRTTCLWGTQVADLRSRKNRGKTALLTVHSWVRNRKVGRSRKSAVSPHVLRLTSTSSCRMASGLELMRGVAGRMPCSPLDQHEPTRPAHPPPGNLLTVDYETPETSP